MSDRYKAIVGIIDDPRNLICILREIKRRGIQEDSVILPPIPKEGGGWVFLNTKDSMREIETIRKKGNKEDFLSQVFYDGHHWFILDQEGNEVGPFDSDIEALQQSSLLIQSTKRILDKVPWDVEDLTRWPL